MVKHRATSQFACHWFVQFLRTAEDFIATPKYYYSERWKTKTASLDQAIVQVCIGDSYLSAIILSLRYLCTLLFHVSAVPFGFSMGFCVYARKFRSKGHNTNLSRNKALKELRSRRKCLHPAHDQACVVAVLREWDAFTKKFKLICPVAQWWSAKKSRHFEGLRVGFWCFLPNLWQCSSPCPKAFEKDGLLRFLCTEVVAFLRMEDCSAFLRKTVTGNLSTTCALPTFKCPFFVATDNLHSSSETLFVSACFAPREERLHVLAQTGRKPKWISFPVMVSRDQLGSNPDHVSRHS